MNKNEMRFIFGSALLLFGMGYLISVSFFEIPQSKMEMVTNITDFVKTGVMMLIIGYFFGSSQGSSDKSDQLNKDK